MKNRLFFLITLVALLVGFFFYQPLLFPQKPYPAIEDRLPDAPIIGKIKIADLTDKIVPLLFSQKVAYRDLISTDFILTQAKNGGIDLLKPTYFYATDEADFGILFNVSDSSKVPNAISKISGFFDVTDTIVNTQVVYKIAAYNAYISFERDWLFLYKGNHFLKHFFQIKYADNTSRRKRWKDFLSDDNFKNQTFSINYRTKELAKKGLEYIGANLTVDSSNILVKAQIVDKEQFPFQLKEKGIGIPIDTKTSKNYIDLHVQINENRPLQKTYIKDLLTQLLKKINFPVNEFLSGWGGDISIDLDRKIRMRESYIEAEFDDENFEMHDVTKERWVLRNQFTSVFSSKDDYYRPFVNQLFVKGFLRREGDNYFFLIIPLVHIVQNQNFLCLYTGYLPKIDTITPINKAEFVYDNTHFQIQVDTITKKELTLEAKIPFTYLIKRFGIKLEK